MTRNLSSDVSSRSATPGDTPTRSPSALSTISTSLWIFPCLFNTRPNAPRPDSTFSASQVTRPLSQLLASLPVTDSVPRPGCRTTSTGSGGPAEVIDQALARSPGEASRADRARRAGAGLPSVYRQIFIHGGVDRAVFQGHVCDRTVQVLDREGHAGRHVG